ncbi:chalcone isomerase family protein [Aquimarina sp. 2201CG5-10]|uniref:chalcone isomerase family protein n=1 Tax=Aquimarina callyspongiae TaxID=3098150 RepID=UPI002AB582D6|nr:chalcone isomerase family protein [Aquimarina sp. 2201CG5-10]MDY8136493.1 chalcone isomerase family protein [Aquimarina sp. 2201CG5-10]
MKRILCFLLSFISFFSYAQTKAGSVQFNDVDTFDETELMLNGAGERDRRYSIALYLDLDFEIDGVEDGIKVAEKDGNMAFTIKVTGDLTNPELKDLVRNGLERATDGNSYLLENQIRDFLNLLPKDINRFDIFKILHKKGKGLLLFRNRELLGTINHLEFKKALFKIWLGENPVDQDLKKDLLGAFDPNPVLGKWKTYDKKTGVAISIVQIYIIDKKVYGTIERMLRQSERDAICYECQGDDKNQNVEGLVILKGLKAKGANKYGSGKFTNIRNGKVSDCQIWVEEDERNILRVKYKGSGGVHEWKRVK